MISLDLNFELFFMNNLLFYYKGNNCTETITGFSSLFTEQNYFTFQNPDPKN